MIDPAEVERYRLPEAENQRIFRERIVPDLLEGRAAQDTPTVVFLVGQPGAGKSKVTELVARTLNRHGGFVDVDSDLYKPYHSAYAALMAQDDTLMAAYTRADGRAWMARAEEYARTHHLHVIIQETSQNAQSVVGRGPVAGAVAVHDRFCLASDGHGQLRPLVGRGQRGGETVGAVERMTQACESQGWACTPSPEQVVDAFQVGQQCPTRMLDPVGAVPRAAAIDRLRSPPGAGSEAQQLGCGGVDSPVLAGAGHQTSGGEIQQSGHAAHLGDQDTIAPVQLLHDAGGLPGTPLGG